MMNIKTTQALRDSIEHWRRLSTGMANPNEKIFTGDCALCALFYDQYCVGCPVFEKTGWEECFATPWRNAARAYEKYGKNSSQFQKAAKKQLKFLLSLEEAQK